eukprot:1395353-Amorphochlora_amoeboformis.AAC.1
MASRTISARSGTLGILQKKLKSDKTEQNGQKAQGACIMGLITTVSKYKAAVGSTCEFTGHESMTWPKYVRDVKSYTSMFVAAYAKGVLRPAFVKAVALKQAVRCLHSIDDM